MWQYLRGRDSSDVGCKYHRMASLAFRRELDLRDSLCKLCNRGDGKWKDRYVLIFRPGIFIVHEKVIHSRRAVLKHLQRYGHNWLIFWRQLRKCGNWSRYIQGNLGSIYS